MVDRQSSFPAWAITASLTMHGMLLFILAAEVPVVSGGVANRVRALIVRFQPRPAAQVAGIRPSAVAPSEPRHEHVSDPPLLTPMGAPPALTVKSADARSSLAVRSVRRREASISMAAAESLAPVNASDVTIAPAAAAEDLRGYRIALAIEARRFKRYPEIARERGWEGSVGITVRVPPLGPPQVQLAQSSGHQLLDDQALQTMRQAVLVARVPDGLRMGEARFELPIEFRLAD